MMLSTELNEAAVEFGRALRHAPAVSAYRSAAEALEADLEAQTVLADLREQLSVVTRLQQAGQSPAPEDSARLRDRQAAVRANDTVMAHLRATNDVKAFLPTVAREVSEALGADYASLIAPTSC
jgi:cell fate (sporulation/competence/biofilm development) regulator YlbF (YheA/YmcA/DUF963 family)